RLPNFAEQIEVLHVARPYLEHVGILIDHVYLARIHHFSHHRQAMSMADTAEDAKSFLTQTLKAIRAGPRFERPSPKNVRPGSLHLPGNFIEDLGTLDGTGPSDHAQCPAANSHRLWTPHLNDRICRMELPAS